MTNEIQANSLKLRLAFALLDEVFTLLEVFEPIVNAPVIGKSRSLEDAFEALMSNGTNFEQAIEISHLYGLYNALMALPFGQALRRNWVTNQLSEDIENKWRPTIPEMFVQLAVWAKTMKAVNYDWDDEKFKPLPEVAEVFKTALAA